MYFFTDPIQASPPTGLAKILGKGQEASGRFIYGVLTVQYVRSLPCSWTNLARMTSTSRQVHGKEVDKMIAEYLRWHIHLPDMPECFTADPVRKAPSGRAGFHHVQYLLLAPTEPLPPPRVSALTLQRSNVRQSAEYSVNRCEGERPLQGKRRFTPWMICRGDCGRGGTSAFPCVIYLSGSDGTTFHATSFMWLTSELPED
jgi:hypothetical protein